VSVDEEIFAIQVPVKDTGIGYEVQEDIEDAYIALLSGVGR